MELNSDKIGFFFGQFWTSINCNSHILFKKLYVFISIYYSYEFTMLTSGEIINWIAISTKYSDIFLLIVSIYFTTQSLVFIHFFFPDPRYQTGNTNIKIKIVSKHF